MIDGQRCNYTCFCFLFVTEDDPLSCIASSKQNLAHPLIYSCWAWRGHCSGGLYSFRNCTQCKPNHPSLPSIPYQGISSLHILTGHAWYAVYLLLFFQTCRGGNLKSRSRHCKFPTCMGHPSNTFSIPAIFLPAKRKLCVIACFTSLSVSKSFLCSCWCSKLWAAKAATSALTCFFQSPRVKIPFKACKAEVKDISSTIEIVPPYN